jgi:hypothetical protein
MERRGCDLVVDGVFGWSIECRLALGDVLCGGSNELRGMLEVEGRLEDANKFGGARGGCSTGELVVPCG